MTKQGDLLYLDFPSDTLEPIGPPEEAEGWQHPYLRHIGVEMTS